jgi:hypothetical protein
MTRYLGAVLALTLVLGASSAAAAPRSLRVLFVGNSLTATNDLPAYVAGLADASGRRLEYRTIAVGGYSLEDHWNLGEAQKALASRSWDVVVMQQGPSALPESQVNLRAWAIRFADEARSKGTRPALLTVWPESYRQYALADVITSYRRAAGAAGADLLPAGLSWQYAWRCDRRLGLYGGDGFHPSPLGTYAACSGPRCGRRSWSSWARRPGRRGCCRRLRRGPWDATSRGRADAVANRARSGRTSS